MISIIPAVYMVMSQTDSPMEIYIMNACQDGFTALILSVPDKAAMASVKRYMIDNCYSIFNTINASNYKASLVVLNK